MTWATAALGDICDVVSGATPRTGEKRFWGGDIYWTSPKDISELESPYLGPTSRTITEEGLNSCAASILPPNSVLLSSRAPIGLVAINAVPMATNQGYKSLVPKAEKIDSKFLFYWLKSKTAYLQGLGNGATFKEISKAIVERIEIPLPPLVEQQRIAAILDKADALRRKRKRTLEILGGLNQSIFLEMFGEPVANPHGFQVRPLSDIAKFTSGGTPSKDIKEFWNGDIPWVSPKDMKVIDISNTEEHVSERAITQTSLKLIEPLAILIVVRGMILAHTAPIAISRCSVTINQDMKAIRVHDAFEPLFVFWCLKVQADYLLSKVSTAAHGTKRLEMQDIERLPIFVPAAKVQRDFVRRAQIVSQTIASTISALGNDNLLFASLQSRAFSGQL